jgi:hypothetical protein
MKVVRKKLFFLSSKDRQATETASRFSVMFPDNLMRVQPNELLRITMTYFSLLNSFQTINNNNNRMGVSFIGGGVQRSGIITIPSGSYNISKIASLVSTAINAINNQSLTVSVQDTYNNYSLWSWTGSITNLKLYFTNSALIDSGLFTTTQSNPPLYNSMARVLGFAQSTTSVSITSSGYVSPYNMFSGQVAYLRLHVDVPPQNIEYDNTKQNNMMNYSDILAQIAILVPPYYPIVFQEFAGDNNTFSMPSKGMKIGLMNFILTDQYNTEVVLNDDFDFVLKIEVLVDEGNDTRGILQETLDTLKLQTLNMENLLAPK